MPSGTFVRRPSVLLALALCSVGGMVTILGRLASGPPVELKREVFESAAGTKAYPDFSPDGQRVAYSARGSKPDVFHIFVRTVARDNPRQLTDGMGNDLSPAWSPDGTRIAFLRTEDGRSRYLVVPAGGGAEQKVADFASGAGESQPPRSLAWTPDGARLVVVQTGEEQIPALAVAEIAGGKVARITNPPDGSQGDSSPAVSPDGSTLAFVRTTNGGGADIYLSDLAGGNPRRLTFDDRGIRGIAWMPDGRDLVYSSPRLLVGWRLFRLPAIGGSPHELAFAGRRATDPAVSHAGYHLMYVDSPSVAAIWRAKPGSAEGNEEQPLIRSMGREVSPAYSPDGKKIADISDQTGSDEIWICDPDGANRIQITHLNGPPINRLRWSPDSKAILYDARGNQGPDLYTIAADAGAKPARVMAGAWNASWSHDGKRIYYDSRGQIWKASAGGENPELLTREFGAAQPVESADGKYVYFRMRRSLWRVPVSGGDAEEAVIPDYDLPNATTIQTTTKGIYYAEFRRATRSPAVAFYDFATKKTSMIFELKGVDFGQGYLFSVSPDGSYILYPKVDQNQSDLVLVENFR